MKYGFLDIICKYTQHDGLIEWTIGQNEEIRLTFSEDGEWTIEEMEAYIYCKLTGKDPSKRFEVGFFTMGTANAAMMINGEMHYVDRKAVLSTIEELPEIRPTDLSNPAYLSRPAHEMFEFGFKNQPSVTTPTMKYERAIEEKEEQVLTITDITSDNEEEDEESTECGSNVTIVAPINRKSNENQSNGTKRPRRKRRAKSENTNNTSKKDAIKRASKQTPERGRSEDNQVKLNKITGNTVSERAPSRRGVMTMRVGRQLPDSVAIKAHAGLYSDSEVEGEMYGYKWARHGEGTKLLNGELKAAHLEARTNEREHGFPDMCGTIVPRKMEVGEVVETVVSGVVQQHLLRGRIVMKGKHGRRTLWGVVPYFYCGARLPSGLPIFHNKQLVSVITKSDGKGKYAVSGVSDTSGHVWGDDVDIERVTGAKSVYAGLAADYDAIKTEALREKTDDQRATIKTKIYLLDGGMRVVQYRGDNFELSHVRIGERVKECLEIDQ